MNERETQLKKLEKYSKAEIVEAIGKYWFDLERLLGELEYVRRTKAIEEERKAINAENIAFEAFISYQRQMIERYGSGGRLKVSAIPPEDFRQMAALERAWQAAREKVQACEAKVSRMLGLGGDGP